MCRRREIDWDRCFVWKHVHNVLIQPFVEIRDESERQAIQHDVFWVRREHGYHEDADLEGEGNHEEINAYENECEYLEAPVAPDLGACRSKHGLLHETPCNRSPQNIRMEDEQCNNE